MNAQCNSLQCCNSQLRYIDISIEPKHGHRQLTDTAALTATQESGGVWFQSAKIKITAPALDAEETLDESSTPVYCSQAKDDDEANNCPIGRINYNTDCCKAWENKCKTQKAFAVIGEYVLEPKSNTCFAGFN